MRGSLSGAMGEAKVFSRGLVNGSDESDGSGKEVLNVGGGGGGGGGGGRCKAHLALSAI